MRRRSWIITLIVSAVVATTLGAGEATAATGPDMQARITGGWVVGMCGYTMSVDWSNVGSADATGVTHITLDLPPEITTSGAQFFGSPPAYVFTESVSPDGHHLDAVFNGTIMPGGDSFMKVQVCAASPPSGPVVATVGNANDVNLANNTYVGSAFGTAPPTPVVAGVDPAGGPAGGGTAVTVTGSNLADGLVLFGGMVGTANSCTATSCTATAPAGSGTVDVTVLTAGGASAPTTADQYSYAGTPPAVPIPAVTRLTTTGGPEAGGTQIYVNGSSLTYGTVAFGGVPGLHSSCGPDWCSAYSPPGKGVVDVTVTTASGTSATSPADQFTYTSAAMVSLLMLTSGSGTISGATSGTEYPAGTVLTLTATPATGYRLGSWAIDGAAAGSANPLTLTMDTSHTVTANFVPTGSPSAGVTPTSLSFGAQRVGTVSSLQQVTVANTSPYPLTMSKTALGGTNPGQFKRVSSCPSSLAPGASCTISVTFTPTSRGAKTATLTVTDNAPDSPQAVTLSGQGIAPVPG